MDLKYLYVVDRNYEVIWPTATNLEEEFLRNLSSAKMESEATSDTSAIEKWLGQSTTSESVCSSRASSLSFNWKNNGYSSSDQHRDANSSCQKFYNMGQVQTKAVVVKELPQPQR